MAAAKVSTNLKVPPTCGLGDCRGAPAIRPGASLANSPSGLLWRESDPMYGSWMRRACILCVLWVRGVCVLGAQRRRRHIVLGVRCWCSGCEL